MQLFVEVGDIRFQLGRLGGEALFYVGHRTIDEPMGRRIRGMLITQAMSRCSHLPYPFIDVGVFGQRLHFASREFQHSHIALFRGDRGLDDIDLPLRKNCLGLDLLH